MTIGPSGQSSPPSSLLVHVCCGPCAVYPVRAMLSSSTRVVGFFHNPNIHPHKEFLRRLDAVREMSRLMSIEMIVDDSYDPASFVAGMRGAAGAGRRHPGRGARCLFCYRSRLEAAARAARAAGVEAFTSSLLFSRYQFHDQIRSIGEAVADDTGVPFHYVDYRDGWQDGRDEARRMGLYGQKYCGCIYSYVERFYGEGEAENGNGRH